MNRLWIQIFGTIILLNSILRCVCIWSLMWSNNLNAFLRLYWSTLNIILHSYFNSRRNAHIKMKCKLKRIVSVQYILLLIIHWDSLCCILRTETHQHPFLSRILSSSICHDCKFCHSQITERSPLDVPSWVSSWLLRGTVWMRSHQG